MKARHVVYYWLLHDRFISYLLPAFLLTAAVHYYHLPAVLLAAGKVLCVQKVLALLPGGYHLQAV